MPGPAPTEILEHIIDLVASDPDSVSRMSRLLSLCICCKALVPRSQKHIFRDITLHPPERDETSIDWIRSDRHSRPYKRTIHFAQIIAQKPNLGRHVQSLTCVFRAQIRGLDNAAALKLIVEEAFRAMDKVQSLGLVYGRDGSRLDFGTISASSSVWFKGVTSLLRCPNIQRLSIEGLCCFPGEVLLASSYLRHLTLWNSGIEFVGDLQDSPQHRDIPNLESLDCDHYSFSYGLSPILAHLQGSHPSPCALVSNIENLALATGSAGLDSPGSFLRQTESLRHLHLTWRCDDEADLSLLDELNENSFDTLSHLTICIVTSLLGHNTEIRNPYGRPWKDLLPRMKNLEHLEFEVAFQGEFDVDPSSFGDHWGHLPEIFTSGANKFPHLREFKTVVHVRLIDDDYMEDRDKVDVEEFRKKLENLVYPRYFLPLTSLSGDQVNYSFEVQRTTGLEL